MERVFHSICITALSFFVSNVSFAKDYLLWGKELCDKQRVVCFNGNIEVDSTNIKIDGRMQSASAPGSVTVSFNGITKDNKEAVTHIKFPVSGQASHIVSKEISVKHWGENVKWTVENMSFSPR